MAVQKVSSTASLGRYCGIWLSSQHVLQYPTSDNPAITTELHKKICVCSISARWSCLFCKTKQYSMRLSHKSLQKRLPRIRTATKTKQNDSSDPFPPWYHDYSMHHYGWTLKLEQRHYRVNKCIEAAEYRSAAFQRFLAFKDLAKEYRQTFIVWRPLRDSAACCNHQFLNSTGVCTTS